jgi:hypothetical protein
MSGEAVRSGSRMCRMASERDVIGVVGKFGMSPI